MQWMMLGKEALIGLLSGYVTNDYAVKMLFRQYGPFGGVILKTKQQFIDNVSRLVERDIINHKTMDRELKQDSFRALLVPVVTDIIKQHLYENTPDMTLKEIPGWDEGVAHFLEFCEANQVAALEQALDAVFGHVALEQLFTPIQINQISDCLWDLLLETVKEQNLIAKLIAEFIREKQDQTLSDFLNVKITQKLVENFKNCTRDLHVELQKQFDSRIDQAIARVLQVLDLDAVLGIVEAQIKQKSLGNFLGRDKTEEMSRALIQSIADFMKSSDGRRLIGNLSLKFFELLEKNKSSIYEVLNQRTQTNLEMFMRNEFPHIILHFRNWIEQSKMEIDRLIDDSVDYVLRNQTKGIKGKLTQLIKNAFLGYEISEKFSVVKLITTYLETNQNLSIEASRALADKVFEFIKQTTIGNIVQMLRANNILQPDTIAQMLCQNIDYYAAQIDPQILNGCYNLPIGDIVKVEIREFLTNQIKQYLRQNFKTDFLYHERFTQLVQKEVASYVSSLNDQKILSLVSESTMERAADELQTQLYAMLAERKTALLGTLNQKFHELCTNKKLKEVTTPEMMGLMVQHFSEGITKYLKNKTIAVRYDEIKGLYDRLNQMPNIETQLTDQLVAIISSNLGILLDGQIEEAVRRNLNGHSDGEIEKMVEEFMGKELKPISIFGGVLGTVFGVASYVGKEMLLPDAPVVTSMLVSVGVCAFVGWLTNVIALKMIFRPYRKWTMAGIPIPFTPGVVAKQKPRFARSMGNFVGRDLLNAATVTQVFNEKRAEIEAGFLAYIKHDDYMMINQLLGKNAGAFTAQAVDLLGKYIEHHSEQITSLIGEYCKLINLTKIDFAPYTHQLHQEAMKRLQHGEAFVVTKIHELLSQDKTLSEILPGNSSDWIKSMISFQIEERSRQMLEIIGSRQKIEGLVNGYADRFNGLIEKSMGELLSHQQINKLKTNVQKYVLGQIGSESSRRNFVSLLDQKLQYEFDGHRQIGRLFDGQLIAVLERNIGFLVQNLISYSNQAIQGQKTQLADLVIETARNQGGVGFSVGNFFLDLEGTVRETIDYIIDQSVPAFLTSKSDEIRDVVHKTLHQEIAFCKVGDLGIQINQQGIEKVINQLVENRYIRDGVKELTDTVIEALITVKIKKFLNIVSLDDLKMLSKMFAPEIELLVFELGDRLVNPVKQEQWKREIVELLGEMVERLILPLNLKDLTQNIDQAAVENSAKRTIAQLVDSSAVNQAVERFLAGIANQVKYVDIQDLIVFEELVATAENILGNLGNQPDIKQRLETIIADIVQHGAEQINEILPNETKDFIIGVLFPSFLNGVDNHFLHLMDGLNIQKVTEAEINAMEPKEIEELFNSFAARYFKTLELYGLWGGILGLSTLGEFWTKNG